MSEKVLKAQIETLTDELNREKKSREKSEKEKKKGLKDFSDLEKKIPRFTKRN